MNNYSPLRYPGGKKRLIKFIKAVIDKNDLRGGTYIELFSGGASIALSLAIDGYMDRVVINDYDRSIYAFWFSVLNNTEAFIAKIKQTPLSIPEWRFQQAIQKEKQTAGLFELGFSTFYLNRVNRSGVLNAGVIGGIEQKGVYKINARFNKEELIDRIRRISQHRDKFILHNEDALELLKKYRNIAQKNLIYLDPPYYVKGRELYINFYNDDDHKNLAEAIKNRNNINWIITYDSHDFINELYSDFKNLTYQLPYSAGGRKKGKESLYTLHEIQLPEVIL